jgi:hypothetical protein
LIFALLSLELRLGAKAKPASPGDEWVVAGDLKGSSGVSLIVSTGS